MLHFKHIVINVIPPARMISMWMTDIFVGRRVGERIGRVHGREGGRECVCVYLCV